MHVALFGLSEPYVCHTDSLCVWARAGACTGEGAPKHLICLTNIAGVKSTDAPRPVRLPQLLPVLSSLLPSSRPSLITAAGLGQMLTFAPPHSNN